MFKFGKFSRKYQYNDLNFIFSRSDTKNFKMISDYDIIAHLDEFLANDESGDEFMDEIDFEEGILYISTFFFILFFKPSVLYYYVTDTNLDDIPVSDFESNYYFYSSIKEY